MGEVELRGHFDGRCSFSTPQKEVESQDLLTDSRGARAQGAAGWGPPSSQLTSQQMETGQHAPVSLTGGWGGGLTLSVYLKLPQEKQSDGHLALKFLSKCPDSGCEQGGHTVKP